MLLSIAEKAYLAGYFDADGCYALNKKMTGKNYKNKNNIIIKYRYPCFQCEVFYVGTIKETMRWIYDKLKVFGHVYWYERKEKKSNSLPLYRVGLTSQDGIREFLVVLRPYIKTKTKPVNFTREKAEWLKKRKIPYW